MARDDTYLDAKRPLLFVLEQVYFVPMGLRTYDALVSYLWLQLPLIRAEAAL
jgi:hypothetical protein